MFYYYILNFDLNFEMDLKEFSLLNCKNLSFYWNLEKMACFMPCQLSCNKTTLANRVEKILYEPYSK
jgi:hypothetical protein